jgi:glycosyltransferase involved in cell wall biosynthesis
MLVRNSVIRDARVQKEANSLSVNGFDVNLVGITDANYALREEVLETGVLINRVPLMSLAFKIKSIMMFLFIAVMVVLGISFSYSLRELLSNLAGYFYVNFYWLFLASAIFLLMLKAAKYFRYYISYSNLENSGKSEFENSDTSVLSSITYNSIAFSVSSLTWLKNNFNSIGKIFRQFIITFAYGKHVSAIYNRKNFNYVHCHDINTLLVGVYLKKKHGVTLIYDAHEMYEAAVGVGQGMALFYKFIHWFSQRYIDGFITINQSFIEIYKSKYPMLPKPTLVMNATVAFEIVEYDGRLHKAAKLPLDNKIILFQGGFSHHRGIERLLEASKYIEDGWSIVFMGWGHLESLILNFQSSYPDKVCMIGPAPQSELPLWTSGAYIGVIPYENHGMNHLYCTPNKLWEYPNAGVPIVASPREELKRIITENNTGWIYDEGLNASGFAAFLTGVGADRDCKVEGCKHFLKNNNWNVYEKNILEMYASLDGKNEK